MIDWEKLLWVFLFFFLAAFAWLDEDAELGEFQWSLALFTGSVAAGVGMLGGLIL